MPSLPSRGRARLAAVLGVLLALSVAACSPRAREVPGEPFRPSAVALELLDLVNRARSTSRTCGGESYGRVPPLALEARLSAAAQAHSGDMHANGFMSHVGSEGSSFIQRAERQGYAWSALAENVAFGYADAGSVMEGWLGSPGHCANIMSGRVTQLGVGVVDGYWTQLFGAPR